jgi:hypothetical protein
VQVTSANPRTPLQKVLTTVCISIFEDRGPDGAARAVPQLVLQTKEDLRLDAHARDLRSMRALLAPMPV